MKTLAAALPLGTPRLLGGNRLPKRHSLRSRLLLVRSPISTMALHEMDKR